MSEKPLQRSSGIAKHKQQVQARTDSAIDKELRRSKRIAELPQRNYAHTKLNFTGEELRPDDRDVQTKGKRIRTSKPPVAKAKKNVTVKQNKAKAASRRKQPGQPKQGKGIPKSLDASQKRVAKRVFEPSRIRRNPRRTVRGPAESLEREPAVPCPLDSAARHRSQGETAKEATDQAVSAAHSDPAVPDQYWIETFSKSPELASSFHSGTAAVHTSSSEAARTTAHPLASSLLNSAALRQLERETANDPLPEGIREYKSALSEDQGEDDDMPRSTTKARDDVRKEKAITVFSQTFLDELTERGILDQNFDQKTSELHKPSNYDAIRTAILQARPNDVPSPAEYENYLQVLKDVSNETAVQTKLYGLFFGNAEALREPHLESAGQQWTKYQPITGQIPRKDCKQVPHPDTAEGLRAVEIPRWIRKRLLGYASPCSRFAFPNFVVELKRDGSMYTAHVQSRHCGAVALQGFVEYFVQLENNSEDAWNDARVGSIEFNGEVVVGNVHWATRSKDDFKSRNYHMKRVMSRFTCGLDYEDFKAARNEARNFREYFSKEREKFHKRCIRLAGPLSEPKASFREEDEESEDELRKHKAPTGNGSKGRNSRAEMVEASMADSEEQTDQVSSTVPSGRKAAQPKISTGHSSQKRSKNDSDRPFKKPRAKKTTLNVQDDESTGLRQSIAGFELTE